MDAGDELVAYVEALQNSASTPELLSLELLFSATCGSRCIAGISLNRPPAPDPQPRAASAPLPRLFFLRLLRLPYITRACPKPQRVLDSPNSPN
jgi:hypothetical protein